MTKHFQLIIIVICVLLAPTLIFAGANKFAVAKSATTADNLVVVPIEISNDVELAALDIPLSFSEGVTLKEVNFEGTRVEYFDMKIASIDNENRTVVIGLLPQLSPAAKADLAVGEGVIANLVFEINDDMISEITLEAITLEVPHHSLQFVYHDENGAIATSTPDVPNVTVSFANGTDGLPETFALDQNYPNPFNPSTQISFSLASSGNVSLSVFNVLGQKVVTLVDGEMDAGNHVVEFDGSTLASGMYFYRIDTDSFSETKKMVMLK